MEIQCCQTQPLFRNILPNHLVVEILASVALHQAVATLLNYALAHTAADREIICTCMIWHYGIIPIFHSINLTINFDSHIIHMSSFTCSQIQDSSRDLHTPYYHCWHCCCSHCPLGAGLCWNRMFHKKLELTFSVVKLNWENCNVSHLVGEGEWLREVEERAGESRRALWENHNISFS